MSKVEIAEQKVRETFAELFDELLKAEGFNEHLARAKAVEICNKAIWDCFFEVQKNQNGGAE